MTPSAEAFEGDIALVPIHVEPKTAAIHVEPAPPPVQAEPEARREARPSESIAAVPHNAPEIPRVSLELPPESGLVLVETSHAAAPSTDEPETPRPRRVRPPRAQVSDEPLQIVETTHKDSMPPA
jgi:hypothetical protein